MPAHYSKNASLTNAKEFGRISPFFSWLFSCLVCFPSSNSQAPLLFGTVTTISSTIGFALASHSWASSYLPGEPSFPLHVYFLHNHVLLDVSVACEEYLPPSLTLFCILGILSLSYITLLTSFRSRAGNALEATISLQSFLSSLLLVMYAICFTFTMVWSSLIFMISQHQLINSKKNMIYSFFFFFTN